MDTEELEALDQLPFSPVDVYGGVLTPFVWTTIRSFVLLTLRERL